MVVAGKIPDNQAFAAEHRKPRPLKSGVGRHNRGSRSDLIKESNWDFCVARSVTPVAVEFWFGVVGITRRPFNSVPALVNQGRGTVG